MKVTFYEKIFKKTGIDVQLIQILQQIKEGKWKDRVSAYRKTGDIAVKKNLPAFTASGTFEDDKTKDSLSRHSGIIAIDIDHIDENIIDDLESKLTEDSYCYCLFRSVSNLGLCLLVKIQGGKTYHEETFDQIDRYLYNRYGINVDRACRNINRLRYVSYDPNLFINENPNVFDPPKKSKRAKKAQKLRDESASKTFFTDRHDFENVIAQIENQRIDLTQNYENWIALGMAIYSEFGDSGESYFHQVSQFHPEYDKEKCSKKYQSFSEDGGITLGTFFHIAKERGIQIRTKESAQIYDVARINKKSGESTEKTIADLAENYDIDQDRSREIVEKIYKSKKEDLEEAQPEIEQIEDFIHINFDIYYNKVTMKYYVDGKEMDNSVLNSVYVKTKKQFEKTKKTDVDAIIESDSTRVFDPVEEFFKKNYGIVDAGSEKEIKKLAECIESPTGISDQGQGFMPNYKFYFIKKWLVSAVAMWHDKHSPLMLILAGNRQHSGKTHFFRYLLPDCLQKYYSESDLNGSKDENILMCQKLMLMNDEMSNKRKADIATIKMLCSKQWFNVRVPYGKASQDLQRRAILCGTSNDLQIINDLTGNRRFIPIEVDNIPHKAYNDVDKKKLWVEAYHLFKSGYDYKLNKDDIRMLNENTEKFEAPNAEEDLILTYFSKPTSSNDVGVSYMSATNIKVHLENLTNQRLQVNTIGMALRKLGFKQEMKWIKDLGKSKRMYRIVKHNMANNQV